MKTIIVPVDFSQQSEYALKAAASLAKKHGAEIIVLHMLELNYAMISSSEAYHPEQIVFLLKAAEKRLEEFLDQSYLEGVKVTPVIKHYKVFSEVNDIAEKHEADLIIMGSHGTDGLEEIFFGSNAEKVVRTSDIPVLVLKKDRPNFAISTFVFACDFREDSIPAFQKARAFADKMGAAFKAVYINTPGDHFLSSSDMNDQISKFLDRAKAGMQVDHYCDYSVERGVLNYAEAMHADLIGIPTHGRKGISHFFMGSIGEDIANHSGVPVMTFKI
ncbi:universal stress protein [Robiginitalea sp. M366]|uniref:universal stress protein n=1 Tax=Robiginitalea aestuariiviva TaxID=3036903 RepID=UPI00240DE899|nr:universal stress protein [Robiginitalea aestuariiviva]MDG1571124.1 universal stress protein [Robiginitalea aestuariiviva]